MKLLSDLRIGTRLGLAFVLVLVLTAFTIGIGILRLQSVASATQKMMEKPIAKERLASDWYRNTFASIRRTSAIVKSSDESLGAFFAEDIAVTTKSSSELQKAFEPLLSSPEEKALYDSVVAVRKKYSQARDSAVKLKAAGDAAGSAKILSEQYLPYSKEYEEGLRNLMQVQRKAMDDNAAEIARVSHDSTNLMVLLGLVLLALGATCATIIARSITVPLKQAVALAERVASGDLSTDIAPSSRDEIGQLLSALRGMNAGLRKMVSEVQIGTQSIATSSSEIAAGNLDLSSRTEQQASSLGETAASMEQLTATVKQNAASAMQANQLALSASTVAVKGGGVVADVVTTMGSINHSARKIVEIIAVIDGIAFQTNILALNAAVEAARAGEQGRGFAVVASEVRNLAQRSAAAAKEIKGLIGDSVEKVDAGSRLVTQAGSTMDEIVASVKRVTDIMAEIMAATSEQSAGIEQVNQAIVQMDQVTQQNAALVEEAAAAAESLQSQADGLAQTVSMFKLERDVYSVPLIAA